ncbi:MAG: hypothetical protein K2X93_17525 [Candidatus Obscuribacterales bacterium]|nr:hypothetical protein [Candidatus Obscuribacterales bacterium]
MTYRSSVLDVCRINRSIGAIVKCTVHTGMMTTADGGLIDPEHFAAINSVTPVAAIMAAGSLGGTRDAGSKVRVFNKYKKERGARSVMM